MYLYLCTDLPVNLYLPPTYIYLHMYISCIYLSLSTCISLHLHVSISTYLSTSLPISISICHPICIYLYLPISTYLPTSACTCIYIYLSTVHCIYLSTYLYLYLSSYLSLSVSTYMYLYLYLPISIYNVHIVLCSKLCQHNVSTPIGGLHVLLQELFACMKKHQKINRLYSRQKETFHLNYMYRFVAFFITKNNFQKITVLSMQPPCWCPSEGHKYGGHKIAQEVE